MTLQEAMEGLNRAQRRKLSQLVKNKHLNPEEARAAVLFSQDLKDEKQIGLKQKSFKRCPQSHSIYKKEFLMHDWEDDTFDWNSLNKAINTIHWICTKIGRIGIHNKEKYGTHRCTTYFLKVIYILSLTLDMYILNTQNGYGV